MSMKQYSKELKLELVKKHLEDGISYWKLGKEYGIEASIIRRWGHKYETFGEDGLEKQNADLCNYSAEFKKKIVLEYLGGNITSQDLAAKYKIHAPSTVRTWIKQYNNHEDLTNSRKEGVYLMAKNGVRKNTTLEERINIVEECINTGCNYASTANKYGCSYGQVYAWVRKYKDKGIEAMYVSSGTPSNRSEPSPFLISNVRDQELPTMIPTDCSQAYSHDPIISPSRHHKFPLQPPAYKQVL